MRSILLALAVLLPIFAATPASATTPTATLTGASITFTTNDEDKDGDTLVTVDIRTTINSTAATISDYFGHFDDGSTHGPYPLFPFSGVTAADLNPGAMNVEINPYGNDTWRFNYTITMTFSDGTSFVVRENNKSLSQDNRSFRTPFTLTTQLRVPDVTGKTETAARATLQAAGLTRINVSHRVDSSCSHLNTVWTESPTPGTIVNPGTTITLTIGDKPTTPCP